MDENGAPQHLVSVASCDSNGVSGGSSIPRSVSLLFSLQFYVDRVALNPVASSQSPASSLLVAFQLLQYEIVMFDASLASYEAATAPAEAAVTSLRHGKSCLFEADPDELVHELQRDAEAPLTLLLLAKDYGRARLRAFAAVTLSLHVGLLDGDVLSCSQLHRICEWASQSGSWELRDHHNAVVGSVMGSVTLSCLGKTLAPHLTQALGVQVDKSQPSSPKETKVRPATAVDEKEEKETAIEEEQDSAAACAETPVLEQPKVETQDSSVQCDEDMLVDDARSTSSLSSGRGDNARPVDNMMKTQDLTVEGPMLYYKSSRSVASSRRGTQRHNPRVDRGVAAKSELLFPRELPPPLFFQKGPPRAKS